MAANKNTAKLSEVAKTKKAVRKGTGSYVGAIIGVALVLFLFGIMGWFIINLRKTGDYFKESIQISAYLNPGVKQNKVDSLVTYLDALPYLNRVEFVSKDKAIERWNHDNDPSWKEMLDANPLPESVDFYVRADYVNTDSLNMLSSNIQSKFPGVIAEMQFPTETVSQVSKFIKTAAVVLLIITVVLTILVIFSIDNTIRLSMYSNRFLIKTMQMVGATQKFIAKPFDRRAVINGLISAAIAIGMLWLVITIVEIFVEQFRLVRDTAGLVWLSIAMVVLGILITLLSTHRAVTKYLKTSLEDLY